MGSKSLGTCIRSRNFKDSKDSVVPYQHHPHSEIWPDCLWMCLPAWWAVGLLFGCILQLAPRRRQCVLSNWGGVLEIQWPFLMWAAWGKGVWSEVLKSSSSGVQPVFHLDPCSSPAYNPEPDPGPVAQPGVLWRPCAHNSGCAAAAAHHWGHSHHLEAAPGPHCSSLQGRWPHVPTVSTLSEGSLCALRSKHPLLDQEWQELLKPQVSSLIQAQCFTYTISVVTEHSAWVEWESSDTYGLESPSQTSVVCQGYTDFARRSLLCLSSNWWASLWTSTCWCRWTLGPGSYLASGWWLVSAFLGKWVTELKCLPPTSPRNCVRHGNRRANGVFKWGEHLFFLLIISFPY